MFFLSLVLRFNLFIFGAWRSWLAYLHGVQGVGSSSLLTPTDQKPAEIAGFFISGRRKLICSLNWNKKNRGAASGF
jgi:hypothetical protein